MAIGLYVAATCEVVPSGAESLKTTVPAARELFEVTISTDCTPCGWIVPRLTNVPVCKSFAITVRGVVLSVFAKVT